MTTLICISIVPGVLAKRDELLAEAHLPKDAYLPFAYQKKGQEALMYAWAQSPEGTACRFPHTLALASTQGVLKPVHQRRAPTFYF